ncbi:MAG: nicotinamide-nucleotide amidohydrolase family protein [Bacteriovoracaceae bacterium]
MTMKAGFLIIASEVLNGKISDVNNQALALFLRKFNVELEKTIIVKDSVTSIQKGLKDLLGVCDLVITSGGLGPTRDDLTKEAIGSFFGKKTVFSEDAMAIAQHNYDRFQRPFSGKDHGYSWLPEGFLALDNPTGMAPGLFYEEKGKYVLCGPGVPREFRGILESHLERLVLSGNVSTDLFRLVNVRTKKVPEEKIFGELDPELWDKLEALGDVSSLPIYVGVDIGVKVTGKTPEELDRKEKEVLTIIDQSPVKSAVWHIGMESLEEVILKKAREKNLTFGFAESASGGLCSHRITAIAGSSQSFKGSIVSYSNSVKKNVLGVSENTIAELTEVSQKAAEEMAEGARKILGVDIAVSITGIAGPGGGTPERPVGFGCLGVSTKTSTHTYETKLFGDREQVKYRFSQLVLMTLLEEMEKFAGN